MRTWPPFMKGEERVLAMFAERRSTNIPNFVSIFWPSIARGWIDQCCKQFSDSEELRMHIATIHHGRHTFSCEVCQRVFSCFGYLKRHMTSTHSNKLPKDLLRYQLRGHNRKTVSRSRALRGEESEGSLTTDDDA
ncbi:unnamed protein product [Calicophoron daubneyi]|uniref:C2H2-type domain-containing protein n=1 Tax=Calicophoron daubneyi TaxID=300641 RepID=A0AAV2T2W2_CALDB